MDEVVASHLAALCCEEKKLWEWCGNELTATVRRNSRNYHNKLINNRNISDQYLAILDPVIYRITAQALLYRYNRAPVCINKEVSGAPPVLLLSVHRSCSNLDSEVRRLFTMFVTVTVFVCHCLSKET